MKHKIVLVAALAAAVSLSGCSPDPHRYYGKSCSALKLEVDAHRIAIQKDYILPRDEALREERQALAAAWDYAGCPGSII